ncbi:MAG: redoxin domain-containing protein [Candidatus Delongbacteria bacterium]|jgi:peroxiredoxin Q/BCP|nr:redoxin domain-containing protein [Candidatus Delongbacteria bacterium]
MVTRQLKSGDKAPAFNGFDQNNNKISVSDFKNTKLILYFYSKENTPGSAAEACDTRDNYNRCLKMGMLWQG